MKVVSYTTGKTVALFPLEAFLPIDRPPEPELLRQIGERYEFLRTPDLAAGRAEITDAGLLYETGIHNGINIYTLSVHSDGIVVNAARTDQTDAFLVDLMEWLIQEKQFRAVPFKRVYVSEIVVDFEKPLEKLLVASKLLNEIATRHLPEDGRTITGGKLARIDIAYNPLPEAPRFVLDKRINSEFGAERYIAHAPMQTAHHVEALRDVERLLS
jgi:hypothetical protein